MPFPSSIGNVLQAAFSADPLSDFSVSIHTSGNPILVDWKESLGNRPTEQQVNDWVNDVTPLPASAGEYSGKLFSEWVADHGGDPNLTKRRVAKETYDGDSEAIYRALVLVLLDEINILRAAVNPPLPARTKTQARAAILAKLDSGDADSG